MSDECTCELMYEDAMASMPEEFAAVARTATDIEGEGDLLMRFFSGCNAGFASQLSSQDRVFGPVLEIASEMGLSVKKISGASNDLLL